MIIDYQKNFQTILTCVMCGDPLHNVLSRLIIVDTEAAVALGSGVEPLATAEPPGVFDLPGVT